MRRLLSPGDVVCDWVGLGDDEHRVIFRMFINTIVWGLIGTGLAVILARWV